MDNNTLTTLSTIVLTIIGAVQVVVIFKQKRQTKLELATFYQRRWNENQKYWGEVIFVGRASGEYYQVIDEDQIKALESAVELTSNESPTTWARDSIRAVSSLLSEICVRILQGQLAIEDIYPILGSELLRHGRPLRNLLDTDNNEEIFWEDTNEKHQQVQNEMQDWLIYHDGLRRRCLILIDLLWAEAVRLEDLPPDDIRDAAEAKLLTGKLNRLRLFEESYRLNGIRKIFYSWRLSRFLLYAEYSRFGSRKGINKKRLDQLNSKWTKRILREP